MQNHEVVIEHGPGWHRVVLNAPASQNKLSPRIVDALHDALRACEADPAAHVLIVEGSGGHFSSGMDLEAAATGHAVKGSGGQRFLELLRHMTEADVVVVSIVDGKASGGGVGLAAASDYVIATQRSVFSLPEILWGLVPCLIAPFLIRRIGFQACRRMTLTTLPIDAEAAHACGLVDTLADDALPRLLQRLRMVAPEGIGRAKRYLGRLDAIDDATLDCALDELEAILASPDVVQRLTEFARSRRYPWEFATARGPADERSRAAEVRT
ncbi:enoyl-CoA hydratase-related protein [Burkholderia lata]|uniref:Polyketide biosynthesis enoyl-CoA hydratase n=1 Tax=Burkholderia lata (strain ATCC 17760 / DSM 23089 / LMG 22485 / NCIMB 9086 / R18194 / 383) TaxID=482957 RepID=A0A6P2WXL3_BURL3|nr:enoyl-CoA hydratase-related protein [Burkholderia lata]VWD01580.1 polyketide biosynthesis enoyl-CoA hydratase [Burkholderia lata]